MADHLPEHLSAVADIDTAASTPRLSLEDALNSVKVSMADLCAKGASHYALKNYNEAAEYYARASELQAELNGEMDPENAEILFLYGRSLFKVGQSKSDVLGGAGSKDKKKPKPSAKNGEGPSSAPAGELDRIAEEEVAIIADKNGTEPKIEEESEGTKKPLFQFTGDENFEDSDEDEEAEEGGEDDEEEEDDLAVAFEVLDLARVLYTRKMEQPEEGEGKGKETGDSSMMRHIKERLADTHDLLAEISLENERFPNAVSDFRESLSYKKELYPEESEILAEAHFKLSLALEFASITRTKEDEDAEDSDAAKESQIDEAMREEAATELEAAIASTKLKLHNKEVELAESLNPEDNEEIVKQIAEAREVIADMEQRLVDLRAPPIDVNAAISGPAGAPDSIDPMGGILGAALGESPAEAQKRIEEAKKNAKDLSGLVRRKAKPAAEESINGKRKAEDAEEDEATESKKAKVEDAVDA